MPAMPNGMMLVSNHVTAVLIKVTESREEKSVYLTSPAPLKLPPKIT